RRGGDPPHATHSDVAGPQPGIHRPRRARRGDAEINSHPQAHPRQQDADAPGESGRARGAVRGPFRPGYSVRGDIMLSVALNRLTAVEYLEIERAAEHKSEFFNGQMFGMAGASMAH